jgi:hypothetical protein
MSAVLSVRSSRPLVKHPGESLLLAVHCGPLLGPGELLQSPLPVEVSPEGLSLGPVTVNAAPFPDGLGGTVSPGQGLRLRVAGGLAGTDYLLTLGGTTTAGNTRIAVCELRVRTD